MNPNAADEKLRRELLEAGPTCLDADGKLLICSPNETRTQRAGIYELRHLARTDRRYCELRYARARLTPEANTSEMCRRQLHERIDRCAVECKTCSSECVSLGARALVSIYRCSLGLPVLGLQFAVHSTDVGLDVRTRFGAVRTKGRPSIPESAWAELHRVIVSNPVNAPILPRNSVSCRKAHREAHGGQYMNALNQDGSPRKRTGYMVRVDEHTAC